MMPRASLRILVQSDLVGAIIGRSGNTIKSITIQTKARIDVHREENSDQSEKIITISGSPESCSDACYRVLEIIQQERLPTQLLEAREMTLKILAPANSVGRLIGKSGNTIKKTMEQTGTKMSITTSNVTESTGEHVVIIIGKIEQLHQAEKIVSSKLRTAYSSDMTASQLYPLLGQPYLLNQPPTIPPGSYAPSPIIANMPKSAAGGSSLRGSMPPLATHQNQIPATLYPNQAGYLHQYPSMNVPPHAAAAGGVYPVMMPPSFEYEKETVYMYIPSSTVGAIIGKSGAAIKEMINSSGATIKVATSPPNNNQNLNDSSNKSRGSPEKLTTEEQSEAIDSKDNPVDASQSQSSEPPSTDQKYNNIHPPNQTTSTNDGPPSTRKVTISGTPASQYYAQYMIYRKVAQECSKSDISLMVEIYVPLSCVGRIIGKGGVTVKKLQSQTRSTIRLLDDSQNNVQTDSEPMTSLQITGDFEGSQSAQRQIRYLIKESQYSRQFKQLQHARGNESSSTRNNNAQRTSKTNFKQQQQQTTQRSFDNDETFCDSYDKSDAINDGTSNYMQDQHNDQNPAENSESLAYSSGCYQDRSKEGNLGEKSHLGPQPAAMGTAETVNNNQVTSHVSNNLNFVSNQSPFNKLDGQSDTTETQAIDTFNYRMENGETTSTKT